MSAESSIVTTDIYDIAGRLWETADQLRANSDLKAGEYSTSLSAHRARDISHLT